MCTLTYFPEQDGRVWIASNRDESRERANATVPQLHQDRSGHTLLYPIDPEKKGTWLAVSDRQQVQVLLNGAFAPHEHRPPYRKSRGIVLLEAFRYDTLHEFAERYDGTAIEPFTLVRMYYPANRPIEEVRWDGTTFHHATYAHTQPQVWSAAQLYNEDIRKATAQRYRQLADTHRTLERQSLKTFQMEERYREKMARHGASPIPVLDTVSTSQLLLDPVQLTWWYYDWRHHLEVQLTKPWQV